LCVVLKHDVEPAYSQQTQLLPPHSEVKTLCSIQGSNLHGACPNLALKLSAEPGAPLEKQTAAKAPESAVAAVKSVGCQSNVVYHGHRARAVVSGVQVGQSIPRAPPCLRRIGSCLASTCGDCPGNIGSVDRCPEFATDLALRRTVPTSERCSESPLDFTSSLVFSIACDNRSTLAEIQLRYREVHRNP